MYRLLRYKSVYLPLCKEADTPFHIQGDYVLSNNFYSDRLVYWQGEAMRYGEMGCEIPSISMDLAFNATREMGVEFVLYVGQYICAMSYALFQDGRQRLRCNSKSNLPLFEVYFSWKTHFRPNCLYKLKTN